MFLNVFGLSTLGGDVVRGLYLGDGRRPGLALNSVIFDRISGLAILMAMGAIALLAFPSYHAALAPQRGVHRRRARARGGLVDLPAAGSPAAGGQSAAPPGGARPGALLDAIARCSCASSLLSLVFHLSQVGVQWLLARAAGTPLPVLLLLVMHPILSLMMALPVSIGRLRRPGGRLSLLPHAGSTSTTRSPSPSGCSGG